MKKFALVVVSVLLLLPLVTVAAAQTSTPDARPQAAPAPPANQPPADDATKAPADRANEGVKTEAPRPAPDVNINNRTEIKPDSSGSALPRTAVERTTVFGLSPLAAANLGAALLVVVVLAIVAMSRNSAPDIDTRPRI